MIGVNGLIQNHPKVTFLKRLLFKITHFGNFKDDRISVIKSIKIDSNTPKKVKHNKDLCNIQQLELINKYSPSNKEGIYDLRWSKLKDLKNN